MSAIAHEVSRRMTADYAKERAKGMAREGAVQMRDRALENPWTLQLAGAAIGAIAARAFLPLLGRVGREPPRTEALSYRGVGPERFEGSFDDMGDRPPELKERASAKTSEYTERLRQGAQQVRERIPSTGEMKARASEHLAFSAVGALCLGALLGLVVPVTERERRALEPAKEKVRDLEGQAMEKARDLGEQAVEKAVDTAVAAATGSAQHEGQEEPAAERREEPPPAIH